MEESEPLSVTEACCEPKTSSNDLHSLIGKRCLVDKPLNNVRCGKSNPVKLSHVGLYQEVPQHMEFREVLPPQEPGDLRTTLFVVIVELPRPWTA